MTSKKETRLPQRTQTLTFINTDPGAAKNKNKQQLARTHGIRNAFRKRYQSLQDSGDNFRQCMHPGSLSYEEVDESGNHQACVLLPDPSLQPSIASIDPFETLAVNASRLTELLSHHSARQAGEPVFSVNEQIDFRLFHDVFEGGMQDPSLAHALCLTLKFAANRGQLDGECIDHRTRAVEQITSRLSSPESTATTNTIGTILLLVGIEGRLGEHETASMHLHGVRRVVQLCYDRNIFLSDPLKRALFWQDLNTSLLAGTERVFSHDTFAEIHWHRDAFKSCTTTIPQGFQCRSHILGPELLEILGDITLLQCHRDDWVSRKHDKVAMLHLDNQQASIESRLQLLALKQTHPLAKACIYAAYMCAYALFTEVWTGSELPARVSMLLLQHLQAWAWWEGWEGHADFLVWATSIGAASADGTKVAADYAGLWNGASRYSLQGLQMTDFRSIVETFFWSVSIFHGKCQTFWRMLQQRHWEDIQGDE